MKRFALVSSLTTCACLVFATPSFAADPVVTGTVDRIRHERPTWRGCLRREMMFLSMS
jgi:hypothetical protein